MKNCQLNYLCEIPEIEWMEEIIAEKFDNVISLMHPYSMIYGGVVRDILANKPLKGDIDIAVPGTNIFKTMDTFQRDPRWKSDKEDNIRLEKPKGDYGEISSVVSVISKIRCFQNLNGEKVQLIGSKLKNSSKFECAAYLARVVDITCCGVVMTPEGRIFEVLPGAYDQCKSGILTANKFANPIYAGKLQLRVDKLVSRGWKNEINVSRVMAKATKKVEKLKDIESKSKTKVHSPFKYTAVKKFAMPFDKPSYLEVNSDMSAAEHRALAQIDPIKPNDIHSLCISHNQIENHGGYGNMLHMIENLTIGIPNCTSYVHEDDIIVEGEDKHVIVTISKTLYRKGIQYSSYSGVVGIHNKVRISPSTRPSPSWTSPLKNIRKGGFPHGKLTISATGGKTKHKINNKRTIYERAEMIMGEITAEAASSERLSKIYKDRYATIPDQIKPISKGISIPPPVYRSSVRDRTHYNLGSPFAEVKRHKSIVTTTGNGDNDIHSGREKLSIPQSIKENEEQISKMTKQLKEKYSGHQGQYSMAYEKIRFPKFSKDTKGDVDVSDEKIEIKPQRDHFGSSTT